MLTIGRKYCVETFATEQLSELIRICQVARWATKFNFELLNIQQIDTAGFCISDLCISLISANGYLSPQCDFFGFLDAIFLFSWIADSFAEPRFGFLSKDSRAPFGQPTNDIN